MTSAGSGEISSVADRSRGLQTCSTGKGCCSVNLQLVSTDSWCWKPLGLVPQEYGSGYRLRQPDSARWFHSESDSLQGWESIRTEGHYTWYLDCRFHHFCKIEELKVQSSISKKDKLKNQFNVIRYNCTYLFFDIPIFLVKPLYMVLKFLKLVLLLESALQCALSVLEETSFSLAQVSSLNLLFDFG